MAFVWLMVAAALVGGCSTGGDGRRGGQLSTDPEVYCAQYAQQCPGETPARCLERCTDVDIDEEDSCWFRACGVATGYCDNEVPGDPQILACADEQGWFDACGRLAATCSRCTIQSNRQMCEQTSARGVALDCATVKWELDEIETGC